MIDNRLQNSKAGRLFSRNPRRHVIAIEDIESRQVERRSFRAQPMSEIGMADEAGKRLKRPMSGVLNCRAEQSVRTSVGYLLTFNPAHTNVGLSQAAPNLGGHRRIGYADYDLFNRITAVQAGQPSRGGCRLPRGILGIENLIVADRRRVSLPSFGLEPTKLIEPCLLVLRSDDERRHAVRHLRQHLGYD